MFLDGFQCCCDIYNLPLLNLVKQRSLAQGDNSQESCHYSIQDTVVIIAHDGETWIERGASMEINFKRY